MIDLKTEANIKWHELKCGNVFEYEIEEGDELSQAEVLSFRKAMVIVKASNGSLELFEPKEFNGFHSAKLIVNEQVKPKVKVEYVKVVFNHVWEAIKAFEQREFDLYTNVSSETYSEIDNAPDVLRYINRLYRKVEREVTWQDSLQDFVAKSKTLVLAEFDDFISEPEGTKASKEFIAMCHLVASMTDNK